MNEMNEMNEMCFEALMVGFEPKEGEATEQQSLEEEVCLVEMEFDMAFSYEENAIEVYHIPTKKRAIRRKATVRHNRRDLALTGHIHKDYGVKVREFPNGTIRVMSTKFHRKEHVPDKRERPRRYGLNSYLKEYEM